MESRQPDFIHNIRRILHLPERQPAPIPETWLKLKEGFVRDDGPFIKLRTLCTVLRNGGDGTAAVWESTPDYASDKYSVFLLFDGKYRAGDDLDWNVDAEYLSHRGILVTKDRGQDDWVVMVSDGTHWERQPDNIDAINKSDILGTKIDAALSSSRPFLTNQFQNSPLYRPIFPAGPKTA